MLWLVDKQTTRSRFLVHQFLVELLPPRIEIMTIFGSLMTIFEVYFPKNAQHAYRNVHKTGFISRILISNAADQ